jgi:hypothetical protein
MEGGMRSVLMVCALGVVLGACANDDAAVAPDSITVFVSAQMRQCEEGGVTPEQSAARLAAADVPASRSSCGVLTGMVYPAVCGAGNGRILLHDIPRAQQAVAEGLGFAEVDSLTDAEGPGFMRLDCATGAPLP